MKLLYSKARVVHERREGRVFRRKSSFGLSQIFFETVRYELINRICRGEGVSLLDEGINQFLPRVSALPIVNLDTSD